MISCRSLFFPKVEWEFGPGQYTFLYIPELGRVWESHPFSIAGWREEGKLFLNASTNLSTSGIEGKGDNGMISSVRDLGE